MLDVDVVAERNREHAQVVLEVVEPDADHLRGLVEHRPDVAVVLEVVPADRLDHEG